MGYLRVDNNVLARTDLSLPEKLICSFIKLYEEDNKKCIMSDFQFAASIGISEKTVERAMTELKKKNFIKSHLTRYAKDGGYGTLRVLTTSPKMGEQDKKYFPQIEEYDTPKMGEYIKYNKRGDNAAPSCEVSATPSIDDFWD